MRPIQKNLGIIGLCGGVLALAILLSTMRKSETGGLPAPITDSLPEEIRGSFSDWMQESGEQDLQHGIKLAKARGERMRELIRSNPEQAVAEAITLSEWSALPDEIKPHVEEPFSALVDVEVLMACGTEASEASIITEFQGHGSMEAFVYGRRRGLGSKNGAPVQGIRLGRLGALREEIFQPLDAADEAAALTLFPVAVTDPGGDSIAALAGGRVFYFQSQAELEETNTRLAALENLPGPDVGAQMIFEALDKVWDDGGLDFEMLGELAYAASLEWTGTPRDMYVILVDFSDLSGQPTDPVALSNSINTTVSQQIWDMSYGKTHVVCTVNPTTYRMDDESADYTDTLPSYPNAYRMHSNATALVEAEGVDLSSYETICVFFAEIADMEFSGLASIGGSRIWINGTTSTKTLSHEIGHNYGARHADTWLVAGNDPVDPNGLEVGYGDFTDIMGSGTLPSGHFNAWHKKFLNWFETDNWMSVSNSGTYRVHRSDHRDTSSPLRGLEIDKGMGDQYWVGLRQEITGYETFSRGAYVLWKQSLGNESLLLDMTPTSGAGKYDGGLALGQTYSDTAAAVHITPTARGGQTPNEWMDMAIQLGSFPGNHAPSASLDAPANLSVRTSVLFSVTASDLDGDELAYYWDFGDGLVKPNSPDVAAAWLSGGAVNVSCVVSDMKGGTNRVAQSIVISDPLDSWTQRISGTTANLNDIALGNGLLVAVGDSGKVATSSDGVSWSVVDVGNPYFHGVVFDGVQFIAAGVDNDSSDNQWKGTVYTSANGTSWARRHLDGAELNDISVGGGNYVAVGDGGTILQSTDGVSWSAVASGTSTDLQGVGYGDGMFVVVGDEGGTTPHVVLTSANGLSWADYSSGAAITDNMWLFDVEYCNDRFFAGGWRSSVQHSTDHGQTFSSTLDDDYNISAFAYGDGIYLAAGTDVYNANADINLISLDGARWSELSTANQANRSAAVFYNGTFITVGDGGSIWQSNPVGALESGFAIWQLENAAALGFDRDPLDDADHDGNLNLTEYALGTLATDPNSMHAFNTEVDPGGYFQVSIGRDGIMGDIDYLVERSTNLLSNDWSTVSTVTVIDHATNLTVRSAFPMAAQTNEFLRLNIELK